MSPMKATFTAKHEAAAPPIPTALWRIRTEATLVAFAKAQNDHSSGSQACSTAVAVQGISSGHGEQSLTKLEDRPEPSNLVGIHAKPHEVQTCNSGQKQLCLGYKNRNVWNPLRERLSSNPEL